MIQCKYCRSSLPDGTNFCSACGQALTAKSNTTTVLSQDNIPTQRSLAPKDNNQVLPAPADTSTARSDQGKIPTQPLVAPKKRQFIAPYFSPVHDQESELSLEGLQKPQDDVTYQQHRFYQQAHMEHNSHEQPQVDHGSHEHPQAPHASHQQPQMLHGSHEHPQAPQAPHQQPQMLHGSHEHPQAPQAPHQQPQMLHGSHERPQAPQALRQPPQASKVSYAGRSVKIARSLKLVKGSPLSFKAAAFYLVVATLLIVALVVVLPRVFATPPPSVSMPTTVDLGQVVPVTGSNFASNSHVTIALDIHTASTKQPSTTKRQGTEGDLLDAFSPQITQYPIQDARSGETVRTVTVGADGTFKTMVYVDTGLIRGKHTLYVLGQDEKTLASEGFTIKDDSLAPALALCGNGSSSGGTAAVSLGPVTEGESKAVTITFKLCTQGSGTVDWTSTWDAQKAPWLDLKKSGQIKAPQLQQLQISGSAAALNAGTYTTTVTFKTAHSQGNTGTIQLQVTLLVQQKKSKGCLKTDSQALTFTSTSGEAAPSSQIVTLLNCGNKGNWLASATTTDGSSWLAVSPTSGNLDSKAAQKLAIAVNPVNMAPGSYSGTIIIGSGSSTVQINVTFVLNPSVEQLPPTKTPPTPIPPCIKVNPSSLSFAGEQGGYNPGTQSFTISNCGDTGTITTGVSTNDGASWLGADSGGLLGSAGQFVINVSVDTAGLSVNQYTGYVNVKLTDTNGATATQQVTVNLTVNPPCTLSISQTALSFAGEQGGYNPAAQSFTASTGTNCAGTVTTNVSTSDGASWLSADSGGSVDAANPLGINVYVDTAGLSANQYTGSVNVAMIDTMGATSPTQQVTVSLTIFQCTINNQITNGLTYTGDQGGSNPNPQSIIVTGSTACQGTATTSVSTTDGGSWLSADSGGQVTPGNPLTINVYVDTAGLSANQYTGSVLVALTDTNGVTNAASVAVTLTVVCNASVSVNPTSLSFAGDQGGSSPSGQNVTVSSNCAGTITTSASTTDGASWLSADSGGSISASGSLGLNVYVNTAGLYAGQYTGTVTFTLTQSSGATATATVSVSLTITGPCISVSPTSLSYSAYAAGSNPAAQSVTVTNCGLAGTITTSISTTDGASWLSADSGGSLAAGSQSGLNVYVTIAGLPGGQYTGYVYVTLIDAYGDTANQTVAVDLTVIGPSFTAVADSSTMTITVNNTGDAGTITTSVSTVDGGSWLSADSGVSLAVGGQVVLQVYTNGAGMADGQYTGYVYVTLTDAYGMTYSQTITVTLTITTSGGG